ncbi:hypothetical protein COLO4_26474 [Corchorus olitorius]|uniref:Uncharacterized protein n=1 Tax=Corchorus olitorius TaxID=93759 RepID=A0A1R3HWT9_9ROSI|nr:hypothetical protein COLO4_26474 [Corchorus olitorius]
MSVFYQEEQPRQSKRCKFLATVLKEAFSNCHTFNGRLSASVREEENSSDIDDESEVVVSEIRSRAMEKMKRRPSFIADSYSWVLSPSTGEIFITSKLAKRRDKMDQEDDEKDDEKAVLLPPLPKSPSESWSWRKGTRLAKTPYV